MPVLAIVRAARVNHDRKPRRAIEGRLPGLPVGGESISTTEATVDDSRGGKPDGDLPTEGVPTIAALL